MFGRSGALAIGAFKCFMFRDRLVPETRRDETRRDETRLPLEPGFGVGRVG
jgi:hypothetical protein